MTQINLLPWREQVRQTKKIRLAVGAGLAIAAAVVLALFTHIVMKALVGAQERKNNFIQAELTKEQAVLFDLNNQKRDQKLVDADLHYIFSLRQRSYKAVHLLDALVHVVPEGGLLVKVLREGDQVTLIGEAQSNLQVTLLMQNIAKTNVFYQPVLSDISSAKAATASNTRIFQIKVLQRE